MKRAAGAAVAVGTSLTEFGSSSHAMFVVDLDDKFDGFSSARTMLSMDFAETGEKDSFTETAAHFVPVERHAQR